LVSRFQIAKKPCKYYLTRLFAFGAEGEICTLAPVNPAYSLSRGKQTLYESTVSQTLSRRKVEVRRFLEFSILDVMDEVSIFEPDRIPCEHFHGV